MSENGQTDDLQKLKEERDAYQQAAITSETNELTALRELTGYHQQELEQLRGEVRMWRRKAEEGAQEALDEQGASEEVSEPS